jgi:hypothetical protein
MLAECTVLATADRMCGRAAVSLQGILQSSSSDAEAAEEFSLLMLKLNLHGLQERCEEDDQEEAAAPDEEAADAEEAANGSDGPSEAAESAPAGEPLFICCIGQGHGW